MKRRLTLLIFISFSILSTAQSFGLKEIIIKTGRHRVKETDIRIANLRDYDNDFGSVIYSQETYKVTKDDEEKGTVYFEHDTSFFHDSLAFIYKTCIPIIIKGLKKTKDETIVITDFPQIEYSPIDTEWVSTIKYYNKDSVDMGYHKNKIFTPNNSVKLVPSNQTININGKIYSIMIETGYREEDIWACNPGKVSYHIIKHGIYKYFVVKL